MPTRHDPKSRAAFLALPTSKAPADGNAFPDAEPLHDTAVAR